MGVTTRDGSLRAVAGISRIGGVATLLLGALSVFAVATGTTRARKPVVTSWTPFLAMAGAVPLRTRGDARGASRLL